MEDYAYILDWLPMGAGGNFGKSREPLIYAVGDEEFKLIELDPKASAQIEIGTRTYIGKDGSKRAVVAHVKRRIGIEQKTHNAQTELEYAVDTFVMDNQPRFIRFSNEAEGISLRKHMLLELPGLGKKSMTAILDEM